MPSRFRSLTGQFMLITCIVLILLFGALYLRQYQAVSRPIEDKFLEEGKALAVTLAKTLTSITENDLKNGVTLNGEFLPGAQLRTWLFDDKLTVIPESEQAAELRRKDPEYAGQKQKLFDGTEISLWQYELKYTSSYDAYTDERWQGVIDSTLVNSMVVFALPTAYSDNPREAGYIATHNSTYSPQGDASKDKWGSSGLLSQKYRANRVFNDATGYKAAATKDTKNPLVQVYPRVIDGRTVTMWDISYPLVFGGEHWGAVRVAMNMEKAESMIAEQRREALLQYVSMFAAVQVLLFFLTRLLVGRRIRELSEKTRSVFTDGTVDLTRSVAMGGKDEISRLSQELEGLFAGLRETVASIHTLSDRVAAASQEVTGRAEETRLTLQRVNETVQDVSGGASRQAQGAKEGAAAMEEMAAGIQKVAEASGGVAASSQGMVDQVNKGREAAAGVTAQMDGLRASTEHTAAAVRRLAELSGEIRQYAGVITSLAGQTNILSLNASIEASRSSGQGKGFAVIAGEIRKLAEQSGGSSARITEMIGEIQTVTQEAAASMQGNTKEVQRSVAMVREVEGALGQMLRMARTVDEHAQDVSAVAQQMSAGTEEVSASMAEIAGIAEGSAGRLGLAAQAFGEQLRLMDEITRASSKMDELAGELQGSIRKFKF
ncbi:methyl-accepting chemotaxis protein [Paenibacillus mucilaginosus]|uniref:methyl-accepting chemotaxis protein n=1 Tax=Paenibacillus mucilaginosus TaxID=61624 RepID=UPI003D2020FC